MAYWWDQDPGERIFMEITTGSERETEHHVHCR